MCFVNFCDWPGEFNPVLVLNEPFPHPWDGGRPGSNWEDVFQLQCFGVLLVFV